MRTYIIGNDGIALCCETPAAVNDGEMVVSSKEELLVAPLNGKRLLAFWNALPGVEKRRRVGHRAGLIEPQRSTDILSICSIARRKNCGLHGANCIAPARRRGSVAIC